MLKFNQKWVEIFTVKNICKKVQEFFKVVMVRFKRIYFNLKSCVVLNTLNNF